MNATDWVYTILVHAAKLHHNKVYVMERASQFRPEVLDACIGMACADIQHRHKYNSIAYEMVRDVCKELVEKNRVN